MHKLGIIALLAATACGGKLSAPSPDASSEAGLWDAGPVDEAGYTRCTTPEGLKICGPETGCEASPNNPRCDQCICPAWAGELVVDAGAGGSCVPDNPRGGVGLCGATLDSVAVGSSTVCDDGFVRYNWSGAGLDCVPYSLGRLLSRYVTDTNVIRYADFGLFTAAPLPAPQDCPAVSGFQLCGDACGPCGGGETCTGRSPLHPYAFCVDTATTGGCALVGVPKCSIAGTGCFTFTVEPEAQALANENGACLPLAQCQALAAGLPGGGTCTLQ